MGVIITDIVLYFIISNVEESTCILGLLTGCTTLNEPIRWDVGWASVLLGTLKYLMSSSIAEHRIAKVAVSKAASTNLIILRPDVRCPMGDNDLTKRKKRQRVSFHLF